MDTGLAGGHFGFPPSGDRVRTVRTCVRTCYTWLMPLTPEEKRARRRAFTPEQRAAERNRIRALRAGAKAEAAAAAETELRAADFAARRDELIERIIAGADAFRDWDGRDDPDLTERAALLGQIKGAYNALVRHSKAGPVAPDTCAACERPIRAGEARTSVSDEYPTHCQCPDT